MLSTPKLAFIKGLIKRHPIVVSWTVWFREKATPALPITKGARDIDSTPPAIIRSVSPDLIALAAIAVASRLEPHNRLTVVPVTETGNPASNNDILATLRLSSPA